ncbi:MAG: hypothetical protein ABJA66_08060 [Actinomycetota bacterium]
MTKKYIPETAKARSWNEIEEHFTKWFDEVYTDNIAKLAQHINSSELSERLFAYTSMDKLVVSIYNPIEWNREALHITFDQHIQNWTFEYYTKPFQKTEFIRHYPAEKGIEKFDKFIKMIKW